jgi:hypothetical protein
MRRYCDQDDAVLTALGSGAWSATLRAHAAACPHCAESLVVAAALRAAAGVPDERPLPDPRILANKARLLERLASGQQGAERAIWPLDVAAGVCVAGAGGLLAWTTWSAVPLLAALALLGGLRAVWESD